MSKVFQEAIWKAFQRPINCILKVSQQFFKGSLKACRCSNWRPVYKQSVFNDCWKDGKDSYSKDFNYCVIIGVLPDLGSAGMLEASLIREFRILRNIKGCANIKKGGDNIVGQPPGFIYVVLQTVGDASKS